MTWGNEEKSIYKGFSAACFTAAAGSLTAGIYKMFVYNNGDSYPYKPHNAYVGGDAYNYMSNGNYATAFFVLMAAFALMGIGFLVLFYLSKMSE